MVFGLIGALIGGSVFGAALWGWGIGSLIGTFFAKGQKVAGARLSDTRVQVSTYGVPINRVFGTVRVAGNVIWAVDKLVESRKTKKIGGGLLTAKTEVTTFTYSASWAVALNHKQVSQIRRVWADEKLIFDISSGASAEEASNSQALLDRANDGMAFYFGTETQDPDPHIISIEETSQIPAYRGIAYIVFRTKQLAAFSNRIPNITAEILVEGTTYADSWVDVSGELAVSNNSRRNHGAAVVWGYLWVAGGAINSPPDPLAYDTDGTVLKGLQETDDTITWTAPGGITAREEFALVYHTFMDKMYALGGWNGNSYYSDPLTGDMVQELSAHDGSWTGTPVLGLATWPTSDRIPFPRDSFSAAYFAGWQGANGDPGRIFVYGGRSTGSNSLAWTGGLSMLTDLWAFDGTDWELLTPISGTPPLSTNGGGGYRRFAAMATFKGDLYLAGGDLSNEVTVVPQRDILKFSKTTIINPTFQTVVSDILTGIDWPNVGGGTDDYGIYELLQWRDKLVAVIYRVEGISNPTFYFFWSDDGVVWDLVSSAGWTIEATSSGSIYRVAGDQTDSISIGDTITAASTATINQDTVSGVNYVAPSTEITVGGSALTSGHIWIDKIQGLVSTNEPGDVGQAIRVTAYNNQMFFTGGEDTPGGVLQIERTNAGTVTTGTRPLSEIVTELSEDVGLVTSEIDVTELTDEVAGYVVRNRQTARASIEPLMRAYFFDAVESEGKMKFPKRGGASIATIVTEDLAAHTYGTQFPGLVEMVRDQDLELPDRIDVTYFSEARNYEESTQIAQRIIGNSRKEVSVDFPLVLTDAEAAQIAEVLLYNSWIERSQITFNLSNEYLYLEPGDIVTIPLNDETIVARITRTDHTRPGILKVKAVPEDIRIYTTAVAGGAPEVTPIRKSLVKSFGSNEFFLDIPIINNGDDDHGFYYAAAPTLAADESDWPGVELWLKSESSDVYGHAVDVPEFIFNGTATATLHSATPGTWDYAQSPFTVTMTNGTLASSTKDKVQEGANLLLVGSEIIGFATITDLGSSQYELYDILRGLLGTEWAIGTHGASERVVLLDRGKMARVNLIQRNIGKELTYKRIPIGFGDIDSIPATTAFTNTGIGKKPYAPSNLSATRLDNNSWVIRWTRRPRGGIAILGGFGTPLMEEVEVYEIDFYLNSVVVHVEEITVLKMDPDKQRYHVVPVNGSTRTLVDGETFRRYGQDDIFGGTVSQLHIEVFQISVTVGRGYGTGGVFNA